MATSVFVKYTSLQVLRSKDQQIVLNMFNCIKKKYPKKILSWGLSETPETAGTS
jgi:hypothetical protein